jgi:hypothetical protein
MQPGDGLGISRVRPASDAEWDAAWRESEHATFFHSRAWAEAWAAVSGGALHPAARAVDFEDGRAAVLPVCEERRGRGAVYRRLSPAGTYGGWLSTGPLGKGHAERLFRHLCDEVPGLRWRVNPLDADAVALAEGALGSGALGSGALAACAGEAETTRVLRTAEGFEALAKRFASGARWGARRARREGLEVGIASSLDEWRAYYAAYEDSLTRWAERATSAYAWELFESLRTRGAEHARLWVVRLGAEIVAGALVLHAAGGAVWWHGAARAEHFARQPMHLLMHEILRDACEQGVPVFDFGPSHGHAGVEAFKAGYGGEVLACPMLRSAPRDARGLAHRTLARLFG